MLRPRQVDLDLLGGIGSPFLPVDIPLLPVRGQFGHGAREAGRAGTAPRGRLAVERGTRARAHESAAAASQQERQAKQKSEAERSRAGGGLR